MTGALPAYRRIVDDVRARIASGELQPGAALPSKHALSRTWGVSRQPVEAALIILRTQGLIVGYPGKATYVTADRAKIQKVLCEPVAARQPL